MWCFGEGFSGWTWFGGIGMIIFWIAFIVLAVWIVYTLVKNNSTETSSKALDIARKRYAKGEIIKDEYEEYKKTL